MTAQSLSEAEARIDAIRADVLTTDGIEMTRLEVARSLLDGWGPGPWTRKRRGADPRAEFDQTLSDFELLTEAAASADVEARMEDVLAAVLQADAQIAWEGDDVLPEERFVVELKDSRAYEGATALEAIFKASAALADPPCARCNGSKWIPLLAAPAESDSFMGEFRRCPDCADPPGGAP